MSKTFKIIMYSFIAVLGLALYILLYFLVPMVNKYGEIIKIIVMIFGYISVILFPFGFFNLMKLIIKDKEKGE